MDIKDTLTPAQIEANTVKLIAAARVGHHNTVQQLIPVSNPDAQLGMDERTALMTALDNARDKCVEALIPASDLSASDASKKTVLMYASSGKCEPEAFARILAGSDIHARDGQGRTALHHAASRGSEESIDALLKAGADASARDHSERTPLHHAAINPFALNKIERLLADPLCDPNARDRFGATPLAKMVVDCVGDYPERPGYMRAAKALVSASDLHAINPRGVSLFGACKDEKNPVEKLVVAYATAKMERDAIREATAGQTTARTQRAPSRSL